MAQIDTSMYAAYAPRVVTARERLEAEAARRMQEAQIAQRNRLMELQIAEAQGAMQDRASQAAARRNALASLASPEMVASQNALMGGGGPTVGNAAKMRPVDPRASALYTLMQGGVVEPKEYLATLDPNFGREEVKQYVETQGGRLPVTRFGDAVGKPIPFAPDIQMLNLGGRQVAVDKRAVAPGASFDMTMSPQDRDASARGWAQVNLAKQREAREAESARAALTVDAGGPDQVALTARFGKAPPGFRWKTDGSQEAIPGGPADIKSGAEGEKRERRKASTVAQANVVLDMVGEAKGLVGNLTAGPAGAIGRFVPGTDSRNLSAKLETIKANLGFDRLQQMRDESPTGGALGQVAVQELNALQSTVASLDQLQSPTELSAALDKIDRHYTRWLEVMGAPRKTNKGPTLDTKSLFDQADAIIKGM